MASYKKSEITKESILSAATELFLEQGYKSTTVRDICARSGVSLSRVNYHYSSKAELASGICRDLFRNLYTAVRRAMHNDREYSLVTEAVSLRYMVHLICDDSRTNQASAFYRDVAEEGILGRVFTPSDQDLFSRYMASAKYSNIKKLSERIGSYSLIFGASFSSLVECFRGLLKQYNGDRDQAETALQNILACLSLQMMDMPHDVQQSMVELSGAYYNLMQITLVGLTEVSVSLLSELSLLEKVKLIEPIIDSDRIKLKSSSDRKKIELDTTFPQDCFEPEDGNFPPEIID